MLLYDITTDACDGSLLYVVWLCCLSPSVFLLSLIMLVASAEAGLVEAASALLVHFYPNFVG